ncbi:pitrilysin family protein [uncultured Tyzzerella sp.]|uniref:M16 family metallopeptidase n=1 Tax=uncultured Tyzzerella sp. TaxID=2321398 RepID=UPI002943AC04|nr:pitrilysin family protein [uncultured Tyzzerella sp.]
MFDTIKLENGVSIVMEQISSVRSVALGIFIKNGSINETPKNNGISHFIEHMLFKGTAKRTAKDIAEEIDNIGGQLNAFTSKEYTCYYARVLDTHIDTAIDVLTDMIFNSKFDNLEIEKEAKVILEEISMYEDTPDDVIFTKLQKEIWKDSPLGYSILGSKENVSSFKHKDFVDYINEKYVGENIVVAIGGSFDREKVLDIIKQKMINMPKGKPSVDADKKYIYTPSRTKIYKDIEQLHLALVFEGISIKDKYNYSMSLLSTIIGGGMSSILFQKVREQYGLAYSIYAYNNGYINNGLFNIYVALNKEQLDKTINIIYKEIEQLKRNKITKEQIEKTKEQLKSNYIMGLENTYNRMSSIGRSKILIDKIKTPDEIIQEVDLIQKEDIDYLIDKVFNMDKMSISLVGKVDDIKIETL